MHMLTHKTPAQSAFLIWLHYNSHFVARKRRRYKPCFNLEGFASLVYWSAVFVACRPLALGMQAKTGGALSAVIGSSLCQRSSAVPTTLLVLHICCFCRKLQKWPWAEDENNLLHHLQKVTTISSPNQCSAFKYISFWNTCSMLLRRKTPLPLKVNTVLEIHSLIFMSATAWCPNTILNGHLSENMTNQNAPSPVADKKTNSTHKVPTF